VYVICPEGATVTWPNSGCFVITIAEAGGSGKLCGGTTVGVLGSTKINFCGSSTDGGVGRTGGIRAGGVGSAEVVEDGDGEEDGEPLGVGEVVLEEVGEGDGVSVIPWGVGVGVGKAFGRKVGRICIADAREDGRGASVGITVEVGVAEAVEEGVGEAEDEGDALGEVVAVAEGDAVDVGELDVVGRGEEGAVAEVLGVGEADEVGVVVGVTEPLPGQVCERRIPESEPLIKASEPAWTMRIRSATGV
jgi:hypothetical protein